MEIKNFLNYLFGYGVPISDACDMWDQIENSDLRERFKNVAIRLYSVDRLRYLSRFNDRFPLHVMTPKHWSSLLKTLTEQQEALEFYLLCTCVDALATDAEGFKEFPTWIKGKKLKDLKATEEITKILQAKKDELSDPDIFRMTVANIYETVYTPRWGNQKGFLLFFESLPTILKDKLIASYVISDLLDKDKDPEEEVATWQNTISYWNELSKEEKITRIGKYFYQHRRNPFTHQAIGKPLSIELITLELFQEKQYEDSTIATVISRKRTNELYYQVKEKEGKKYRIIQVRIEQGEDEWIILRLVVEVVWLLKLGFQVTEEIIQNLRLQLLRREWYFRALSEIVSVHNAINNYGSSNLVEELDFSPKLKIFPLSAVRNLKEVLAKEDNTKIINGVAGNSLLTDINKYFDLLNTINEEILKFNEHNFNRKMMAISSISDQIFRQGFDEVEEAKSKMRKLIKNRTELKEIQALAKNLYQKLDRLAYDMI